MSNTILAITIAEVASVAAEYGLVVQEQSAFYKIATAKKAVYCAKTKKGITRIDVSGFTPAAHPALVPPRRKNGKVTCEVNVNHPQARDALANAIEGLLDGAVIGDRLLLGHERVAFEAASKK